MNNNTITLDKKTVKIILIAFGAVMIFILGMITTVGINYFQNNVQNVRDYAKQNLIAREQERIAEQEYLQKLSEVAPNTNRDINADAYAIKIAAITEIAGEYKKAEMSNLLGEPKTRADIYQMLEKAIDEKTQEYLDIYALATKSAELNYITVTEQIKDNMDENVAKNLEYNARMYKFGEKEWQEYNVETLKDLSDQLKNDLGNKLLKCEDIL